MIYKKDTIDMSIVQCPYEEEQGYIYISDEYTNNILKLSGYNDIDEYDFQIMCRYKFLEPYLYEYALKSASNVYHYARVVIKGRFELGESVVSTSSYYSFLYARDVVKGRFELGEQVITTSAEYSYRYARDAIKGRFELCEPVIATNALYSYYYAHDVLNGRFELGESSIAVAGGLKKKYFELTGIQL